MTAINLHFSFPCMIQFEYGADHKVSYKACDMDLLPFTVDHDERDGAVWSVFKFESNDKTKILYIKFHYAESVLSWQIEAYHNWDPEGDHLPDEFPEFKKMQVIGDKYNLFFADAVGDEDEDDELVERVKNMWRHFVSIK